MWSNKRSLCIAAAMLLMLVACGESEAPASTPPDDTGDGGDGAENGTDARTADGEPIRVGYIGALTGGSATMGEPTRNGIVLAFEEANEAGGIDGRPVELSAFDDEADPSRSVAGAQGFIRDGDVEVVIGGPNSPTVLANREVLAEAGIPALISVAQEDQLVDPDSPTYDTTFRLTEPNQVNVDVIAGYVADQGCELMDIVADDSAYGQGGAETIAATFAEHGLEVGNVVSHPPEADDMTSEALSVQQGGADCVYVFSLGSPAALFFEAADAVGLDIPAFGGRGLNQTSFLELVGERDVNLVMPTVANPNKSDFADFAERYADRFGEERWYMFGALGYDTGRTAIEALRRSGGEGGDALVEAFESIDDLETTVGNEGSVVQFGPDDHEAGSPQWVSTVTVEQGEFVLTDVQPDVED